MSDTYLIDLKSNVKTVKDDFLALAQAVKAAQQATSTPVNAKRASAVAGGRGGQSQAVMSPQRALAQQQQAAANALRAQTALINAFISNQKAQKRYAKYQAGQGKKNSALKSLIYSTRVGVGQNGVQIMPLIGQTIQALSKMGPEAEAVAAALALATAGIIAQVALIKGVSGYLKDRYMLAFSGGANDKQAAKAAGIAAAVGVSNSQFGADARQFNEDLQTNPYANAAFASKGVRANFAGSFGDTNDIGRLMEAIEALRKMPEDEARRATRGTALEKYANVRNLSDPVYEYVKNSMAAMNDPKARQSATDADALLNVELAKLAEVATQLGAQLIPDLVKGLQTLAAVIYVIQKMMYDLQIALHLPHGGRPIKPQFGDDAGKAMDAHTDAMQRHTDAMNQNTRALDATRQTFGPGRNNSSALPSRYFGPNNYEANRQTIHLGQLPILTN